jgi:Asp-tRNA(Asn)/Glu-tRNA(Gln) amidotransferase A subunit family amidase
MKPTFGLVPRAGVIPTWPYLDTHGPLARTVADAALLLAAIVGADRSDPLALTGTKDFALRRSLVQVQRGTLSGVRLGLVEAHVPRAQMSPEAVTIWDRAVSDLRAAGATVETFLPSVTLASYKDAFAAAARDRGDVAGDPKAPAPTANALYRYFAGRADDPRAAVRRGYPAYRALFDVLPSAFEGC